MHLLHIHSQLIDLVLYHRAISFTDCMILYVHIIIDCYRAIYIGVERPLSPADNINYSVATETIQRANFFCENSLQW